MTGSRRRQESQRSLGFVLEVYVKDWRQSTHSVVTAEPFGLKRWESREAYLHRGEQKRRGRDGPSGE